MLLGQLFERREDREDVLDDGFRLHSGFLLSATIGPC